MYINLTQSTHNPRYIAQDSVFREMESLTDQ